MKMVKYSYELKRGMSTRRMAMTALFSLLLITHAGQAAFGSAPAAKFYTKDTGFHRVAVTNLAAVFSMTPTQVSNTAFYVMNFGKEVASVRDSNGDIIFYGHKYETRYTDENVYWILPGNPSVIPPVTVSAGTSPYAASFPFVKRLEQNSLIRADLVQSVDEDPILWRLFTSGLSTRTLTTTLVVDSPSANASGTIKVRLKGATDIPGRYYHRAQVDLNGVMLGTMDFEGFENKEAVFSVPAGLFVSGNNSVKIESTPPAGTTFDGFYLDYIEAQYDRAYVAFSNRLTFKAPPGSVQVGGFSSSNLLVWKVINPQQLAPLVGHTVTQSGTNWTVSFSAANPGSYTIARLGSELSPVRVQPASGIDLRSSEWQLDHLVITHPALYSAAQQITSYRQSQGLISDIITVDDIYDSFNFGIRDVRALERFLTYAFRTWNVSPRYVVVVGDGSLDYKNQLGFNDSQIPATPMMGPNGLYASDYLLGDPTGTGFLEIAVGRIPFNASSNVTAFISKMISYEQDANWRTNHLVTSDANDYAGDFMGIGEELTTFVTDRNVIRGHLSTTSVSFVRQQLIDGINNGRELSMYVGHGTPNQLSSQSVLLTSDMSSFTNANRPTTFLALGCLIGTFNAPGVTSLGEGLVKAKGGAANVIAASTMISANDGKVITEKMLGDIYSNNVARLGDAWITGKNELIRTGRLPAFHGFQYLGDPASAIGDKNAPRGGNPVGPSRGSYNEWRKCVLAPALEDIGIELNATDDDDQDFFDNYAEFMAGTDPFNPGSLLHVINIKRPVVGKVRVTWPSVRGRVYRLEAANQVTGTYTVIADQVTATLNETSMDHDESALPYRFFRISVY